MVEIGQLAIKTCGRDAGKECAIVELLDKNFVLVDGNTRRRKCNLDHLHFIGKKADIKAKASHEDVLAALEKAGIDTSKPKRHKPKEPKEEKKEAKKEKKPLIKLPKLKKEKK